MAKREKQNMRDERIDDRKSSESVNTKRSKGNGKCSVIQKAVAALLECDKLAAREIICQEYPHTYFEVEKRSYTIEQKMNRFIEDGFIDRYTGEKLMNPGVLKILSAYFPDVFPYQSHWKMTQTHDAYWELIPTIDHIYPVAKGGSDDESNWVTTSMKNNSIKSNYTIEEIRWQLYPKGKIAEWDGLTGMLFSLIENDKKLLDDSYIKSWYHVSVKLFVQRGVYSVR